MTQKYSQIVNLDSEKSHSLLRKFTKVLRSGHVYLKSGEECGTHSTKHYEELLIFLQGEGTLRVKNEKINIKENHSAYIPPYTVHNIIAAEKPLKYIYVTTPVFKESE